MTKLKHGIMIFIALNLVLVSHETRAGSGTYGPVIEEVGFHEDGAYFPAGVNAVVNHYGGNLLVSATDVEIPGHGGFEMSFTRTHNSNRAYDPEFQMPLLSRDSPLGHGWTAHYGYLRPNLGPNPEWIDGSGAREIFYRHDALASQLPIAGQQVWISQSLKILSRTGDTYTMYTPDGLVYDLDWQQDTSIRKPVKITDAFGNEWDFQYEPDSDTQYTAPDLDDFIAHHPLIRRVTDDWGRTLLFGYRTIGGKKRLNTITLTAAATAGPAFAEAGKSQILSTYHYTNQISGGFYFLRQHISGSGRQTTYISDLVGEGMGTISQIQLDTGGQVGFTYERRTFNYQPSIVTYAYTLKTHTHGGGTWTYDYDDLPGQSIFRVTVDGPDNKDSTYEYYTYGNNFCANDFWMVGKLVYSRVQYNGTQNEISYSYQPLKISNQLIVDLCAADFVNIPLVSASTVTVDGVNLTTDYQYQPSDLTFPTRITSPSIRRELDYRHIATSNRLILGLQEDEAQYFNNVLVSRTELRYPGSTSVTPNAIRNYKTANLFDTINLTYYTSGSGKRGALRTKDYGGLARETYDYQYGVLSRADYLTGPDLSRSINPDGTVRSETREGVTRTFAWDDDSRLTRITQPGDDVVLSYDSNEIVRTQGPARIEMDYDAWGRLTRRAERVDGSTDAVHQFVYSPLGHIEREITPAGAQYDYTYDSQGRRRGKDATNANDDYSWSYLTFANGGGRVTMTRNNTVTLVTETDALGRVTEGSINNRRVDYQYTGTNLRISAGGLNRTINYDFLGRKTTETHPETGTISYAYNAAGWNTAMNKPGLAYTTVLDSIGRTDQLKVGSDVVVDFDYDPTFGAIESIVHEDVELSFSEFDDNGRPLRITLDLPRALNGARMDWPLNAQTLTALNQRAQTEWGAVTGAQFYQVELIDGTTTRTGQTSGTQTSLAFTQINNFTPQLNQTYQWRVRAVGANDEIGPWSPRASFNVVDTPAVPNPPSSVSASDNDLSIPNQIRVIWSTVADADTYSVYRSTSQTGTPQLQVSGLTATSWLDSGVVAGTAYHYWVKAINAQGASEFSASDVGTAAATPQPDLDVQDMGVPPITPVNDLLWFNFDIVNVGTAGAPFLTYKAWLSHDAVLDAGDREMRSARLTNTPLPAGQSHHVLSNVQAIAEYGGDSYLIVKVDYGDEIDEISEANNVEVQPIHIHLPGQPDLQIVHTDIDRSGSVFTRIAISIRNAGFTDAPFVNYQAYLSTDNTISSNDYVVSTYTHSSALPPGSVHQGVTTGIIPAGWIGDLKLIVKADYLDQIDEISESNIFIYSFNGAPGRPNNLSASDNDASIPGQIRVTWDSSSSADHYTVYRALSQFATPVAVGQQITGTSWIDPSVDPDTTYYYRVSATNALGESDLSLFDTGITGNAMPDLIIENLVVPATGAPWQIMWFDYDQTNIGNADSPLRSGRLWLSHDDQLDANDRFMGSHRLMTPIAAGESVHSRSNIQIPPPSSGYTGLVYLIVEADYDDEVAESDEQNNVAVQSFTIQ